jgi:hypothetical protein
MMMFMATPATLEVAAAQGRMVLGGWSWESSFSLSFSVGACEEGNGPTCRRIVSCKIAYGGQHICEVRFQSNGAKRCDGLKFDGN